MACHYCAWENGSCLSSLSSTFLHQETVSAETDVAWYIELKIGIGAVGVQVYVDVVWIWGQQLA